MNLINNNPYRILGLPITATEREIAKQINTLSTYAEMGKFKEFDTDLKFLDKISRTPDEIEEAKKQIEQSESKLLYSLFWFWKTSSADEIALEVLKEGNTNKAIAIWEKSVFANKNKVYRPKIIFDNLIRQSTSWSETKHKDYLLTKNVDEYIIERINEDNYCISTVMCDLNFEENWIIECDTTWIDGVDNSSYGIAFGRDKSGSYYFFGIAGSGSYIYTKYDDWSFTSLIDWKETPKFNKWGTNHIQIKKFENNLSFFVNHVLVDSHQVDDFFGNDFGFKVTKNQKISFRNFKFSKLVEEDIYGEGISITSKNYSDLKNLSTLYLILATNNSTFQLEYLIKGISLAKSFFSAESFETFSKLIAGEKYIFNLENIFHFYINEIVESLRNYIDKTDGINTSQLISAFANFPVEAKQFLNNRFVSKQIQNIDKEIETTQTKRKKAAVTAIELGKKLVENTKSDVEFIKNVLGETDFQYQIIGDKLSQEIVQCGIDSFNLCKTSNGEIDYLKAIKSEESYLSEYKYALSIAVTDRVKEKAQENLDSCNHYIENKHYYYCWFCGNNPPEEVNNYEITIYKETYRSYFPRKVQFSYVPVSIPRCNECKKVHSQSSDKFTLGLICFAFVGLIIGAYADGYWFAGLLVGGGVGWILGTFLKEKKTSEAAIKDTNQSTIRNYPLLSQKLREGWQFSKPSA